MQISQVQHAVRGGKPVTENNWDNVYEPSLIVVKELLESEDHFKCLDSMNPSQERIARKFSTEAKKELKDTQTGLGNAPMSASGNSSSGQADVTLSPAPVS
ncbi:unnamed protein product [Vicia faba]|uniref:Uncharacterized protein n=1 Tax=Vicia faba TaxID=3906 RepID=A0AAV1AX34_VICFA|nr:unnamed protein product [Vicia faba]